MARYTRGQNVKLTSPIGYLQLEDYTGNVTLLMTVWIIGMSALSVWVLMLALGAVAGYFGYDGPSLLVTLSGLAIITILSGYFKE